MAGLTIVEGPPGSGKTEALVRRAADRCAADPFALTLALVPTARHGDQFRRRVVARCGVALRLDVTTPNFYARRHAGEAVPPHEVAAELLRRTARERIAAGGADRFAPIAGTPGLYALLERAVAELVSARVDPGTLAAAAERVGDADHAALADVLRSYRGRLAERGWRDPREAPTIAASAVTDGAGVPGLVLVDGFEHLGPRELGLVAALAERTEAVVALGAGGGERARWTAERLAALVPGAAREALPPRAAAAPATARAAFDAEAQLRGIARAIKRALAEDAALRPSDFAVTFRQAAPHLALARRVFAEYELPFDPAAGERLAARPFGAWVLALLRLPERDWRLARFAELLRSPFLERRRWEAGHEAVGRALEAGRKHRLFTGLGSLRELPRALRLDADEAAARGYEGYAERLRAAAGAMDRAAAGLVALLGDPGERRTARTWAAALDEALFGADGIARAEAEGYESLGAESASLRADLAALCAIDEALGAPPIALDEFADELEGRMQRPATLLREAGGVLFASMHTLHGLRFAQVFVGGLAEGEFPAPARPAALLGRRAREALRAGGLELPPPPHASEDELWDAAVSRADARTSLWRPRRDDNGRPRAASWHFARAAAAAGGEARDPADVALEDAASRRELAVALASRWRQGERRRPAGFAAWPLVVRTAASAERRRRSFGAAGAREGDLRGSGHGLEWLTGDDVRWSASRLEAWRTCAFQFFGRYALGLSEVEDEAAEADAAIRGSVVHDVLEDALGPLAEAGLPLVPDTLDDALRRLRESGRAIWDEAPARRAFGRAALWRFEWEETAADLEGLLRREAAHNAALGVERIEGRELVIASALPGVDPPLRLTGRIDRADAGQGFVQIVDYKSGRAISRADVESGRRLQLQLYALAARAQLGAPRVVARYAWLSPHAREWTLDTADGGDEALVAEAARHAADVREAVAGGDFRVNPTVPACPRYCEFRAACRVNQYSRYKRWS